MHDPSHAQCFSDPIETVSAQKCYKPLTKYLLLEALLKTSCSVVALAMSKYMTRAAGTPARRQGAWQRRQYVQSPCQPVPLNSQGKKRYSATGWVRTWSKRAIHHSMKKLFLCVHSAVHPPLVWACPCGTPTPSGLNPDEIFASVHHSMLDIYCELLKAHALVHTPANSLKCLKASLSHS